MPPKKRRRPRGEGAFYKRKSDGLWIGAVTYEDEYGDTRRATTSHSDKVTAMEKFRELRAKVESGNYAPRSKMTVTQWMNYWTEHIVKPELDPKTYVSYEGAARNQIIPLIGDKQLPISPAVVRGLLTKVGTKWSDRTAQLTYAVLNVAMKAAVAEEVINKNPLEHVAKPKVAKKERITHTSEQARQVLISAMKAKDPMVTRWAAAFLLGARQGELLGLERSRVDFEAMTVELSWQLQTLKFKPGATRDDPDRFVVPSGFEHRPLYRSFALTRPKSERSKRLTPLPVPLAAILKTYFDATDVNEYGLVWVTEKRRPIPAKYDSLAWHEALARAGVPDVTLHTARHTTATLLQEMGVEESVRMQIMGHSTVAAQRIYAHVPLDLARKALGNLDGLLAVE
ncbi:tyrosine-type recombinase/integrase [Nocardia sp. NPDC046763]|uniref:tyrosine-type recombinase/integrase n=1 Tax=Nocardia sp. NPDC046763 TaxID=3155256 RepID=UPI0033D8FCD0